MYKTIKILFLIIVPLIVASCEIRDSYDNCGIYMEFIFDYNMEYTDSFDSQLGMVDVYIFDNEGKYVSHVHVNDTRNLVYGKQLYLNNDYPRGTYQIITVGGLSEHFRFMDLDDNECTPGVTTIEQVKLALLHETEIVSHEFEHLYFGEATSIRHLADRSVWPIYLVRNTNNFHIILQDKDAHEKNQNGTTSYTFEIIAPEAGAYDYDNNPLERKTLTYQPFLLVSGDEDSINLSTAKINTMRLFADDPDGYRLVIRSTTTSNEVWDYDLINLLSRTNTSFRPDGSRLPLQEYLDRQSEWNIVVLYRDDIPQPGREDSFVAIAIQINGWTVWQNDIGV